MLEKRKFFSMLIGYIIGIIVGLYCKISIVPILLILYLVYLIFNKKSNKDFKLISFRRYFRYFKIIFNKKVLKTIIIFCVISNSIVLYQNYRYENLYKCVNDKNIKIIGIIQGKTKDKYKLKVLTDGYKNSIVYLNKVKTNLDYGDKIEVNGIFSSPKQRTNYKGFDYKNYLKTLGVYGSILVKNERVISKDNINFIFKYKYKLNIKITNIIETFNIESDEKELLKGILLGNKENLSEEIEENFSRSNISYILAVSGMHISYIVIFSSFIFNNTIGKHYSKLITSVIIFVYMCITNFAPSVVRAGIVGILVIMSNFFFRKSDMLNNLSIALLIILIYNPFLIQNTGLQLSFLGTIGIILIMPSLKKMLKNYTQKIEKRAIRKNKILTKKFLNLLETRIMKIIIQGVFVTFSASIMVMPIMAFNFNRVSISSLIISVISSFLVGPIVIMGVIAIITRVNIISQITAFFLKILIRIAKVGSRIPLNQIYIVTPSIIEIISYYSIILILNFFIIINFEKNKNSTQKRVINLLNLTKYYIIQNKNKLISAMIIISLLTAFIEIFPKNLKIFFVDVGQGDSTLIVTPKNKKILIDGGGNENLDFNVRRKNIDTIFTG